MALFEIPPAIDPVEPCDESPLRTHMIDLHFAVRERLADCLSTPTSASLDALRAATLAFLDAEARLVLPDPDALERIGVDAGTLDDGHLGLRRAVVEVASSTPGTTEMQQRTEQLRHLFVGHCEPYVRTRPSRRGPAGSRPD